MASRVRCPDCGGDQLLRITPGFFECREQVAVGAIPPGVHGNPTHVPVLGPCGNRFQVSSPTATEPCFCGRDSIGGCKVCECRLCGLHGTTSGDFLCGNCLAERIGQQRSREEEARRERQLERRDFGVLANRVSNGGPEVTGPEDKI